MSIRFILQLWLLIKGQMISNPVDFGNFIINVEYSNVFND